MLTKIIASHNRFDLKIGTIMVDLAGKNNGITPQASTATIFVTKQVFKNEGVNQGSNFPAQTPTQKGDPNPKKNGRGILGQIFSDRVICRPEKFWPGNFLARRCLAGKFYGQKNLAGKNMASESPARFFWASR